ncbi:hypothetical protein LOTGIDRAFT_161687 [Lottia gigantea]|uniref:Apple domain-containing protein n=1 Tax=Lottia gigantea TaxID=225164 RepID=V3ZQA8_LOTGI|nr:hypothetical protein LOTGIDRAFT_161687 [Lottia gigantea]ESO93578.1 hypothetical protein LOTGIDRAFT_161687 [Lottia gigantea]
MFRTLYVLLMVMCIHLKVQQVRGVNTVTFISIWYGNIYGRACLDVPQSGVTCGWNIQFFFDPLVTALTVYNGINVAQDSHYFVVKDIYYNRDLSFSPQFCLSFTGSNPSITYPQNPNVTANFVCTCNKDSTEDCSSRTYSFNTSTSTSTVIPTTTIAPTTTTQATTTMTPERTTTIFDTISSTDMMNNIVESRDTDSASLVPRDRKHQFRLWKKDHVSDNYNYKYNSVGSVTDCALWCSYYTNCTGFTIYNKHCWAIINEQVRSNRFYENCNTWIRA